MAPCDGRFGASMWDRAFLLFVKTVRSGNGVGLWGSFVRDVLLPLGCASENVFFEKGSNRPANRLRYFVRKWSKDKSKTS